MTNSSKTAIAIRHLAFEDLGAFEPVLRRAGYAIRYFDIGIDDPRQLDRLEADLVILLGGPIGVYEEADYPFLQDEIRFLERRLAASLPTIGICLGAQLMARALGAKVYPGSAKEIGFAPIELTDAGQRSCLSAFDGSPVLHWHGDIFDLPGGAVRLASTAACPNQAFAYGGQAIAFQFHPETGAAGFERWLIGHTLEIRQAGLSIVQLRAAHQLLGVELERRAAACLEAWLGQRAR